MMGCQISGSREARSVFCSHSMRQIAVNTLHQAIRELKGGLWGNSEGGGVVRGVMSGHIMLSLDQPKEAMSLIIHWVSVVYIREEGEGIGGGLSTATEDSLWKMAQLASQDGDVIRV